MIGRVLTASLLAFATTAAAQDKIALPELSRYLTALETAEGSFTQVNADGSISTGTFYLKRPGRMRFEYDAPNETLVIAGAGSVGIFDGDRDRTAETYPLKRTPLSVILAEEVDLTRARMVTGHTSDDTTTTVTAQDPDNPEYGYVQLVFTADPVELRQWKVSEAGGGETTVILGALETGMELPNRLFSLRQETERRKE